MKYSIKQQIDKIKRSKAKYLDGFANSLTKHNVDEVAIILATADVAEVAIKEIEQSGFALPDKFDSLYDIISIIRYRTAQDGKNSDIGIREMYTILWMFGPTVAGVDPLTNIISSLGYLGGFWNSELDQDRIYFSLENIARVFNELSGLDKNDLTGYSRVLNLFKSCLLKHLSVL